MISVFTPSHNPEFLDDCLKSLQAQTYSDWEWIVLLNRLYDDNLSLKKSWDWSCSDPRVKIIYYKESLGQIEYPGIGALKAYACELCSGEILVELDHDDMLAPEALELILRAFEDQSVGFVYSDTAQIDRAGNREESRFDESHGWEYYETKNGLLAPRSFLPYPHNLSYIWYAPNHVRAFRKFTYELVGGYDISRDILDDQDLMSRLYQATKFHYIPEPLYYQRVYDGNSQSHPITNVLIQKQTLELYERDIQPNALAWARREGLKCVDLGSAHNKPAGYLGLDQYPGEGVDIVHDVSLNLANMHSGYQGLPFDDNSVGVIRAVDFLEHIEDSIGLFNEIYRVLTHGGLLLSLTPSTDGRGAFQDPTHVSFFNQNCVSPDTKILCSDFIWREAKELQPGDSLIGFDEEPYQELTRGKSANYSRYRKSFVEANKIEIQSCRRVYTDIGPATIASDGHPWLVLRKCKKEITRKGRQATGLKIQWIQTKDLLIGDKIAYFGNPWEYDQSRQAGWLAGMFDGEGCISISNRGQGDTASLSVSQRESETLSRLKNELTYRNFKFTTRASSAEGKEHCFSLCILGGRREHMRFIGMIQPPRFLENDLSSLYDGIVVKRGRTIDMAEVIQIDDIGNHEVSALQTSTRTFITNGYLSHNSFWYYTDQSFAKYIPSFEGRFQVSRLRTYFPSSWHEEHNISYVQANLIAIKDGPRQGGQLYV